MIRLGEGAVRCDVYCAKGWEAWEGRSRRGLARFGHGVVGEMPVTQHCTSVETTKNCTSSHGARWPDLALRGWTLGALRIPGRDYPGKMGQGAPQGPSRASRARRAQGQHPGYQSKGSKGSRRANSILKHRPCPPCHIIHPPLPTLSLSTLLLHALLLAHLSSYITPTLLITLFPPHTLLLAPPLLLLLLSSKRSTLNC